MTSPRHDQTFREMFQHEASEALDRLARHLLRLEQDGADGELVAAAFRDAHNIKGGAAVVGCDDVRRVAHAMEGVLEPIRRGDTACHATVIDALLGAADAIREILPNAVLDQEHGVDVDGLVRSLATTTATSSHAQVADRTDSPADASASPLQAKPHAPTVGVVPAPRAAVLGDGDGITTGGAERPGTAAALAVPVDRLNDLVRLVGEAAGAKLRLGAYISEQIGVDPGVVDEFRELSAIVNELQERTSGTRMVTISTITDRLHRAVRDLARAQGKDVRWVVHGGDTELDLAVVGKLTEPLLHILRNAVDHGVETPEERRAGGKQPAAEISLQAMRLGSEVVISVRDDGRGVDVDALRQKAGNHAADGALDEQAALNLMFRSGVSTAKSVTDVSGRGVGMDAVRVNVASVRGRVDVRSERGSYTEVRIAVPVTMAVLRCVLVSSGGVRYALPMHAVEVALPPTAEDEHVDGRVVRWVGDRVVPACDLSAALGREGGRRGPAVVVKGVTRRHAFHVDELLGQRDVVVKGLNPLLPRLDTFIGTSAEADGSVLLVLDPTGLIDRARRLRANRSGEPGAASRKRVPRILVVDDALTIRELQRSILRRAGYDVTTATNGEEALAVVSDNTFDLVLTDVEMPLMDGFALTAALRGNATTGAIGIVILTSLGSESDRRRGLEAGADAYIVKSDFDERALLEVVERLVGAPA